MLDDRADLIKNANNELRGEAPKLIETFSSKGFKLFMRWAEAMEYQYERLVLRADTPEEWREARAEWQAMQKLRMLPEQLLEKVKNLDAEDGLPE